MIYFNFYLAIRQQAAGFMLQAVWFQKACSLKLVAYTITTVFSLTKGSFSKCLGSFTFSGYLTCYSNSSLK